MKSALLEQVRDGLSSGYERIMRTLDDGPSPMRSILANVSRVVDDSRPTWLPGTIARSLRTDLVPPIPATDMLGAGPHGLLVFEEPVAHSTHGSADPNRPAPVDGLLWWPGTPDQWGMNYNAVDPDVLVLHVLSTEVGGGAPWTAAVWDGVHLVDNGMLVLPIEQEMTPPGPEVDDLAPAITTLLGFGAAVRDSRLIFEQIGSNGPTAARAARVLAAA